MAFSGTTVWDVRTTGSDTANGGGFDPGSAGFATDLAGTSANTSAPVVTSASYNFVAGDVGAWLFIQGGTNWIPGWYQVASVASNAATLTAGIGTAPMYNGAAVNTTAIGMNANAGCATTASPTAGKWGLDYSQSASPAISYTDMVIGATTTQFTSAGNPVGKNLVGNTIAVTSGTGFTVQRVQVVSTSGTTATCDKALGTAASTGGSGGLGGCLASPGMAAGLVVSGGNIAYIKSGTYILSATGNVAGGRINNPGTGGQSTLRIVGWSANRTYGNVDTAPVLQPGAVSVTCLYFGSSTNTANVRNLDFENPSAFATCTAVQLDYQLFLADRITASNFATCFNGSGNNNLFINCAAAAAAGGTCFTLAGASSQCIACSASGGKYGYTIGSNCFLFRCVAANQNNAAAIGFDARNANNCTLAHCVAYGVIGGAGTSGFNGTNGMVKLLDCVATDGTGLGFLVSAPPLYQLSPMINCAGYNNTAGNLDATVITAALNNFGFINLTASPWTAPTASPPNFAPNSAAGGGAALRAAGYPAALPGLAGTSYPDIGAFQSAGGGPNYFAY
jgi:hypothetical protein